ncbi:MAG TPA: helix-turn-helix transcriptional regulator [Casimicrobiaceae bacterium]
MPPDDPANILRASLDRLSRPRAVKRTLRGRPDGSLGRLVRDLVTARERVGLTQSQVAAGMGTTTSAISRFESGKYSRPTLTTIENYALVVGCDLRITVRMSDRWPGDYADWG